MLFSSNNNNTRYVYYDRVSLYDYADERKATITRKTYGYISQNLTNPVYCLSEDSSLLFLSGTYRGKVQPYFLSFDSFT